LLVGALEERYRLLVSVPLILEYEAVLTRPEHLEASGLSAEDVGAILDSVVAVGQPVRLTYLWRPVLTDPGDDMVLETAVNGGADVLVTLNRRHFESARGPLFVTVVSPSGALRRLEK
jgi:predicted nucleic acid-binding protein